MAQKKRGSGKSQEKILAFLAEHPGEHHRVEIEKATRLRPGSVVGALRTLREDGRLEARQEGTNEKSPILYSAKK